MLNAMALVFVGLWVGKVLRIRRARRLRFSWA